MDNCSANSNRRRFSRVTAPRAARLISPSGISFEGMVVDLSLCGIFLHGDYTVQVGDVVEILIYGTGHRLCRIFKYSCRVVRHTPEGVALEFIVMESPDYDHLMTIILYFAENPHKVCNEFPEVFSLDPIAAD